MKSQPSTILIWVSSAPLLWWCLLLPANLAGAQTAPLPAKTARGSLVSNNSQAAVTATVRDMESEALTPYKYIGNNFSLKFHRPSCPFAKAMWEGHIELFHFRKDAIAAKYAPCRYCLPPQWTSVSATMLASPAKATAPASPAKAGSRGP
jgi:hypothetical protein